MFDVFSNIPHYDLMAWTFWICFGLVFLVFLQMGFVLAVYMDLKKRLMSLQYLDQSEDKGKSKKSKKTKDDKKSKKEKKNGKGQKPLPNEKTDDSLPQMFF